MLDGRGDARGTWVKVWLWDTAFSPVAKAGSVDLVVGLVVAGSPPTVLEGPRRTGPGAAVVQSPPEAPEVLPPAAGSQRGQVRVASAWVLLLPLSPQSQVAAQGRVPAGPAAQYLLIRFHVPTCNGSRDQEVNGGCLHQESRSQLPHCPISKVPPECSCGS